MTRYTKKNKRGGDKLEDIQSQLNTIQEQVNELKISRNQPAFEPMFQPVSEPAFQPIVEPVFQPIVEPISEPVSVSASKVISKKPISKPWVTNKEIKFKDGDNGRVLLAFNRVISHIDNNIKKGSVTKDWVTIKEKLNNASSENEVQYIINQYKVKFASNYVLGGKTKRKGRRNKRKTHKRH